MKIALMVRGYLTVPRPSDIIYAPIDLAAQLADGLTERGHEVTFFAPNGSHLKYADVETLNLRPLVNNQDQFIDLLHDTAQLTHYVPGLWDRRFAGEMFARARDGEFDLVYFHHPEVALGFAQIYKEVPVAYTMHDPFYPWYRELFDLYKSDNQHFISISNNQRRDAPDIKFAATVHNGIDPELFKFGAEHEDYLIIAGRIVPDKGFKEAIQVAKATNHRLFIIGPIYPDHQAYFDQYIKPELDENILYLGPMDQPQLVKYYQKAKAYLMPIQWEEPFGLVMIEAMACGTPVIALNRGSVPEVVEHGKTGYICENTEEMIEAVGKVDTIDRKYCRKYVEEKFVIKNMIDGYEQAFKDIIKSHKKKPELARITNKGLGKLKKIKKVAKKITEKQG